MKLVAVKYVGQDKIKYDSYKALSKETRKGDDWNNELDADLKNIKSTIKKHYIKIQNYRCPYCQQRIVIDNNSVWDAEHIIPKDSHPQFMFEPENLCVSCKDCNREKWNKQVLRNKRVTFAKKSEDYIFYHPHFDEYEEHIHIVDIANFYLPLTEKGRKTIEICGLLRFLFNMSDYGSTSLEVKENIVDMSGKLLDAKNPLIEQMYLSLISRSVEIGKVEAENEFLRGQQL